MGLIEQIEAENMKENVPQFNVATPSRSAIVSSRAAKSVSRTLKALSSPRRTAGSARRLRCAAFPSVWVWSVASPCIPPRSRMSTLYAPAKFVAQSSIICAGLRGRLPRSRKRSKTAKAKKTDPLKVKGGSAFSLSLRRRAEGVFLRQSKAERGARKGCGREVRRKICFFPQNTPQIRLLSARYRLE